MDTAGDAYIRYKFLKAKRDIAFRKAAEKQFEINSPDSSGNNQRDKQSGLIFLKCSGLHAK